MTLRIVVDTNILISALIADGPPGRLIGMAIDGDIELVIPDDVLTELQRVLSRKLGFDRGRLVEARRYFSELASELPRSPKSVESVTGDASDDKSLACAAMTKVDVLVTGDQRHLLPVGEYRGVRILKPQTILAELAKDSP